MKLILIYPSHRHIDGAQANKKQAKSHRYPGMGLAMVAALTPPGNDISIVDDDREAIDYGRPADLVGISILTANAMRGYRIAREYRRRGVPVVLGGIHATACPEEAAGEADAVVAGEAEDTWPGLLRDFEAGRMQGIYRSTNDSPMAGLPLPRRDLLRKREYITVNTVQATRGCPFNCEFCSMTALMGHKTRYRPVEEVVEEVRALDGRTFVFNDDNVAQGNDYFKSLFERLIPLRKIWVGNASWNVSRDPEMMDLMARSGCAGVSIGFESIGAQPGLTKAGPPEDRTALYQEAVRRLHRRGISVMGCLIFGFDNDDETVFPRTLEFANASGIDTAQINLLVPYPGTPLHDRLEREGRIVERDWSRYVTNHVCFEPRRLSREALFANYLRVRRAFYGPGRVASRVLKAVPYSSPRVLTANLAVNLSFRRGVRNLLASERRRRAEAAPP
ncbi:MAG: B12-binding domain-containing radical SAM protein [Candidatus Aminicenantes bacterium]|nr:B12-binding domain-containing radical SAM protein [Candidatus Aminicenantes bacterium]NLH77867.1 B12-binding domain-containing radical SAM protein [Acidobacteriota bacterium]